MSRSTKEERALLKKVYDQVPSIKCKGLCQEFCGALAGPQFGTTKAYTAIEEAAMVKRCGSAPRTRGDSTEDEDLGCNKLTPEGRCSIYEHRPLICRVWGVTTKMRCPHGCEVEKVLSTEEVGKLYDQIGMKRIP